MSAKQILLVEDEKVVATNVRAHLRQLGYHIPPVVSTGPEAIEKAIEIKPDLILMDIMLQGAMDGVEAAQSIRRHMDIPIVFLSSYADEATVHRAKCAEPYGYILKPFQVKELQPFIEIALYKHQADVARRQKQQWLENIVKSMAPSIITTDSNGHITFMNPSAEYITGYTTGEALGKPFEEICRLIDFHTAKTLENPVSLVLRQGKVIRLPGQVLLQKRDGSSTPVDDSSAPISDENGAVNGVVVTLRDDTEKLASEQFGLEWRETAERNARLKKEFLSNINHEIREPLHIILGYANLIEEVFSKQTDLKYRQYFRNIHDASKHLMDTLNMLVEISRFHDNDFPIKPRLLRLEDVLRDKIEQFAESARKKALEFIVQLDTPETYVYADPYAIGSAFSNVLNNAVKFTRKGAVRIRTKVDDSDRVHISVSDTGTGITAEDLPRIFDEFSRSTLGHGVPGRGIGLGLALTRHYVHHSNGSITVRSHPGKGTQVTMSFPLYQQKEHTEQRETAGTDPVPTGPSIFDQIPVSKQNTLILLVEDDVLTQRLIRHNLGSNFEIHSAKSVKEARSLLDKLPIGLIIMDISLQGRESGLDFTRELKTTPNTRHIPIIIITAHSSDEHRKKSFAAGCDIYLSKPFEPAKMEESIHDLLKRKY